MSLDFLDNIHAVHDLPKNDVLTVQPFGLGRAKEELGAVAVLTRIGHRQYSRAGVLEIKVLILELGAVDGFSSCAIVVGEVTSLAHEVWDHAVEDAAFVPVTLLAGAERSEVLAGLRDLVKTELHHDAACRLVANLNVKEDTRLHTDYQCLVARHLASVCNIPLQSLLFWILFPEIRAVFLPLRPLLLSPNLAGVNVFLQPQGEGLVRPLSDLCLGLARDLGGQLAGAGHIPTACRHLALPPPLLRRAIGKLCAIVHSLGRLRVRLRDGLKPDALFLLRRIGDKRRRRDGPGLERHGSCGSRLRPRPPKPL
mmetsp:Transcript_92423/g.198126  ORF Transcript_92423/g.198126 Transcript_92423/m.198126 type:complete len:311 (+) Transcript_92423:168-1100(+)